MCVTAKVGEDWREIACFTHTCAPTEASEPPTRTELHRSRDMRAEAPTLPPHRGPSRGYYGNFARKDSSRSSYGAVLWSLRGSVLPRVLPWATLAGAYAGILHEIVACNYWPAFCGNGGHPANPDAPNRPPFLFVHTYAYHAILLSSGFGLVFRLNQSLTRYWEARTAAQNAAAKWMDGALMALAFDDEEEGDKKETKECAAFARTVAHLASLLHAVALHTLRGDSTLASLVERDAQAVIAAGSDVAAGAQPKLVLCDFAPEASHRFAARNPIHVLGGVHPAEARRLQLTAERVHMVLSWIHRLLVRRRKAGGLAHDAPIVSRIYQVLSDGNLWYLNALKVVDTPFPFPYAQVCISRRLPPPTTIYHHLPPSTSI